MASTDVPASRKAKQISMLEHAKKKSMWSGSKNAQTIESYVLSEDAGEKVFKTKDLKYPPALLKIIDEVIVNAIDHHTHYPKLVTEIKIEVKDNTIAVYNNGPGIPVELTKNINGVEMYTPQLIASEFLAGDNLDDVGTNVKGGTNGIGLKLAAAFSSTLVLETVDAVSGMHYIQSFKNGLTVIEPPEMKKSKEKPYTRITFTPDYSEFKLNPEKFSPTLSEILQTRAWQAAAYTSAKVYFNKTPIPLKSFEDFCQMHTENLVYSAEMTQISGKYPWEVCFAVSDGKERNISIVNGVYMPKGGTHIQHIQKQLVDALRPYVEKGLTKKSGVKFNKNFITNNVFVFMKGAIPSPEFLSQTKEAISDPIEKFAGYSIADMHWKRIWELIGPSIMATFLKKQLGDLKTRANRGKVDVPKYKEAKYCRDAKKCHQCGLIITEGDSASGTADTGLLAKASPNFNYDWFGVYGIQGVPMNGLKESLEIKQKDKKTMDDSAVNKPISRKKITDSDVDSKSDSEPKTSKSSAKSSASKPASKSKKAADDFVLPPRRVPNQKLIDNERIDSLKKILGLDYNKTYALTEIGDKEFKTLRYGFIVGLTDQDLDGFNIFGMIVTYLLTYWPSLIFRNFIRRINTPVIRLYPNSKKLLVEEFYSEREYRRWIEEHGENVASRYTIEFYKGLGTHDEVKGEVTQMFRNIDQKIKTYVFDNDFLKNMTIYYGKETASRKKVLATNVDEEHDDELIEPISKQFVIDTKLYQRDNIIRKLLNLIDGFVTSRRKVFFAARKQGRNKIKVAGLAGIAVEHADYHHGETSLEQTIVRMAQGFPMARNLPLLQPYGQFGTRSKGYKDYAASRYIHTMINWRLADTLFRREDDYILEYEVSDGHRYEPKYYMPVIPYVLCESNDIPATGWKITMHARHIDDILKNTRDMIQGKIKACGRLGPWKKDFKGRIRNYNGKSYYVGNYHYIESENAIHIDELPPGICSNAYLRGSDEDKIKKNGGAKKGIQTKEWIDDFEDNTDMNSVNIILYLKPGAYEAITSEESKYGNETFDAFTEYLELKECITHHINLVNQHGEVVEYKKYEDVFNDWFVFRKKLYEVRVEREIILINLEIKMLKNMQRFSTSHDSYGITNKTTESAAVSIIKKNKYDIFNHTLLASPKYTTVDQLILMITSAEYGADYDYLLRMSYRDLTEEAYAKREQRIADLLDRLKYLNDETGLFKGAKIWLKELDELEEAIKTGIETKWRYGENAHKFKN